MYQYTSTITYTYQKFQICFLLLGGTYYVHESAIKVYVYVKSVYVQGNNNFDVQTLLHVTYNQFFCWCV